MDCCRDLLAQVKEYYVLGGVHKQVSVTLMLRGEGGLASDMSARSTSKLSCSPRVGQVLLLALALVLSMILTCL